MATARTNSEAVFHLVTVMGIGRALRIEDVQLDLMRDTIRVTAITPPMKPQRLDLRMCDTSDWHRKIEEWLDEIAPLQAKDETDGYVTCSHWGMFPCAA